MYRALRTLGMAAGLTLGLHAAAHAGLSLVSGNPPQGPGGDPALVEVFTALPDPIGIPVWYGDQQLLRLEFCPAGDPNCITDPVPVPDTAGLGQGIEGFYWIADTGVDLPGGGTASLRLNLEKSFANEAVVAGDQTVFLRLRVRFLGAAAGTYTLVHPYGTDIAGQTSFDVAGPATTFTEDFPLAAPLDFLGVLGAADGHPIGPNFLTAVDPPPPLGYVGSGLNATHTVRGSPFEDPANPGQRANLFRVTGPGGTVETRQFNVVGLVCSDATSATAQAQAGCGPNTAPVAVDDPSAAVTGANTPVTFVVTGNDLAGDGTVVSPQQDVPIDPARITIVAAPTKGTAVPGVDGDITYTPAPGTSGVDTFTYNVADFAGAVSATPATVTVLVEDLRVGQAVFLPKLMKWHVEGTSSEVTANTITVHLGGSTAAPVLGSATVQADGRWKFEGKTALTPAGIANVTVISANGVTQTVPLGLR